MGRIIRMTLEEAKALHEKEKKTPEYKAQMEKLRNMRDEDIDYSDCPAITDEDITSGKLVLKHGGARPGAGRKPMPEPEKKKFTALSVGFSTANLIRKKAQAAGVTIDEFLRCRVA